MKYIFTLAPICLLLLLSGKPNVRTIGKAQEAKAYCLENNLNTAFCLLVDMSIHSGKYRLFVYDLKNDEILHQGLVSHGCCDNVWSRDYTKDNPNFSNVPESYCSSLGKYRIGARGWSNWGINVNYKLHGLEKTNDKAYERLIVLHSWDAVSDTEVYPNGTPEGWGCPAVSNNSMRKIDLFLKAANKDVLLWVYE